VLSALAHFTDVPEAATPTCCGCICWVRRQQEEYESLHIALSTINAMTSEASGRGSCGCLRALQTFQADALHAADVSAPPCIIHRQGGHETLRTSSRRHPDGLHRTCHAGSTDAAIEPKESLQDSTCIVLQQIALLWFRGDIMIRIATYHVCNVEHRMRCQHSRDFHQNASHFACSRARLNLRNGKSPSRSRLQNASCTGTQLKTSMKIGYC